jgi:hypothetical protein
MFETIKEVAKRSFLYELGARYRDRRDHARWLRQGGGAPAPHLVKQRAVLDYASRFGIRVLVETGTYMGAMIDATKHHFDRIYSIELDQALHERAVRKFRRDANVTLLQGDSGSKLADVLAVLDDAALFWLDAHFSGGITSRGDLDTPIVAEVRQLLAHPLAGRHVVLIDDARLFDGTHDYPTLATLRELVASLAPSFVVEVRDDVLRLHRRVDVP